MPAISMRIAMLAIFTFINLYSIPDTAFATEPSTTNQEPSIEELEADAQKAYREKNWVKLYSTSMKLHKRRPYAPEYMMEIVRAAAAVDRRRTAYHFMLMMQQQGLSYDMNSMEETEGMRGAEAYEYINKIMIEAGQPAGEGELHVELPVRPGDLGDVAWDETRKRFLVGTRTEGKLLSVADDGSIELLLQADEENGLWSIEGLAVDAKSNALWIASSATPDFAGFSPADAYRAGLYRFELDSLQTAGRYNLAADGLPHSLGSIAVADDGTVYVIDRAVPMVYHKPADSEKLEHFIALPGFVALTDISVTPDRSRLFVSDAVMGILLIDPLGGASALLKGPETLNQYGIYGVDYVPGALVITQSGISPQRLMRLELDTAGAAVETVTPMAIALEGFDWPGVGTLRDDSLYYFANQGSRSGDQRARMMVTPLDAGGEITQPDMRVFEESMEQKGQQ